MYILGGAVAFARTSIKNEEIASRGLLLDSKGFLVEARCSCLSTDDYFSKTGKDRFQSEQNSNPSQLGAEAVTAACEALGISVGEIGMLIGDCSTPRQTIPAESQRVGGILGLKIPTFDILLPVLAPIVHLDLLGRWKKSELPKYIALVYTNTPTIEPSLVGSTDQYAFGDGAAALIVSAEIARGLFVELTKVQQVASGKNIFSVYGEKTEQGIFSIDSAIFENTLVLLEGRHLCFATASSELHALADKVSEQRVLSGGVSQSGFALSTSTAATVLEALSLGTNFGLLATCGNSVATACLRRA